MAWICKDCGEKVEYVCNAGCTVRYNINKKGELGESSLDCVDDVFDGGYYCECELGHDIEDIEETAVWKEEQ